MLEMNGNLWDFYDMGCNIAIPTNGTLGRGGLVMGAGLALEAKRRFPDLPTILGKCVEERGNYPVFVERLRIISFPTKNKWWKKAELSLIEESMDHLRQIHQIYLLTEIVVPRVGCGLGGLKWKQVRPILDCYGDWLMVVDKA